MHPLVRKHDTLVTLEPQRIIRGSSFTVKSICRIKLIAFFVVSIIFLVSCHKFESGSIAIQRVSRAFALISESRNFSIII